MLLSLLTYIQIQIINFFYHMLIYHMLGEYAYHMLGEFCRVSFQMPCLVDDFLFINFFL